MITRLEGVLEELSATAGVVRLSSGSIAYEVLLPAFLAHDLADHVGRGVRLHTLEYLEAQGQGTSFVPRLIGFASASDRRFFELFTSVKGLGSKRALRALARRPGEIAALIAARDVAGLRALPEIGPRLAETVIAELHGKVNVFVEPGAGGVEPKSARPSGASAQDAIRALVALGEKPADAERLAREAIESLPSVASADEILARVFARQGR